MLNKLLNVALQKKYAIAFWSLPAAVVLSAGGGLSFCLFLLLYYFWRKWRVIGRAGVIWPECFKAIGWLKLSNSCLMNLRWLITMVTHEIKKSKSLSKFCGKVFNKTKWCLSAGLCSCVCLTWADWVWLQKLYYCESQFVENACERVWRSVLSNKYLHNIINNSLHLTTSAWIRPKY